MVALKPRGKVIIAFDLLMYAGLNFLKEWTQWFMACQTRHLSKHVTFTNTDAPKLLQNAEQTLNNISFPKIMSTWLKTSSPMKFPCSFKAVRVCHSPLPICGASWPSALSCVDAVWSCSPESPNPGALLVEVLSIPWSWFLNLVHVLVDDVVEAGLSESVQVSTVVKELTKNSATIQVQ